MAKAVFYLLADSTSQARNLCACRLLEKALQNKRQAYIYVDNTEAAKSFDTLLWTFRDISFIPHEIYHAQAVAPILIGHEPPPANCQDILLNLTDEMPNFFPQFAHIIEAIPNSEPCKSAARQRYQQYKNAGLQMETFNL